MKKLIALSLALTVFVFFSCDKNQKAVNQLEGEWKVTNQEFTAFGVTQSEPPEETIIYTFNKCDIDDGNCDGTIQTNGTTTDNFKYNAADEGESLVLVDETNNTSLKLNMEKVDRKTRKITFSLDDFLESFDDSELVDSTSTSFDLGITITQTLEKQ